MNWKKWNDSGRIFRLTLSWKAPSIQIRIFLKAHLDIFSHESAFRLVFRLRTKPVNPLTETLGWFSNRTGTSVDDGKARGKDWTRLPVLNLLLCDWSSQLFDLRASSLTDVPVLLLSQPNVWFKASSTRIRVKSYAVSKISLDSCARGPKTVQGSFCWIQSRMSL